MAYFNKKYRHRKFQKLAQNRTVHRGAIYTFPVQWIHLFGSNKSTGLKTGKSHLCAVQRGAFCQFPFR